LKLSAKRQIGETNPIGFFVKYLYLNNMRLFFEQRRVKNEAKTNPNEAKTNPILRQISQFQPFEPAFFGTALVEK